MKIREIALFALCLGLLVGACSAVQIKADEAKAARCAESPKFAACQLRAMADCTESTCTKTEIASKVESCLLACDWTSSVDASAAGAQ